MEQLVDVTEEVLVNGENGCPKAVQMGGQLGNRVEMNG